jgi:hypothetical protein
MASHRFEPRTKLPPVMWRPLPSGSTVRLGNPLADSCKYWSKRLRTTLLEPRHLRIIADLLSEVAAELERLDDWPEINHEPKP